MTATIRQVVDAALRYIGEVSGPGTQTFSEDRLFDGVVRGFDLLFKKRRWNNYRKWFRLELDETTGLVTTDSLEVVRDFEDFISVHRDGETAHLPVMPNGFNPYATSMGTGSRLRYWDSLHVSNANYQTKRLQFYPVTSEGFVNVHAMAYPLNVYAEEWDWEDIMYLDKDLLMFATAIDVLAGDDMNAQAAALAQAAMESKFKDILGGLADHPIPIRSNTGIPDQWQVSP